MNKKFKNLAIIPARGGSKRIKNKNIKLFFNKPIIYWSIKAARETKLFDKIIVSTDSNKIAKICKSYNVEIPFLRPKIFSGDKVSAIKVVKHALFWFKNKNILFDRVCCIFPAAPFITKKTIKKGFNLLKKKRKSFAFTISSYSHPIQRALKVNKKGYIKPVWPSNIRKRTQDFENRYHDAGQIYWGTFEAFTKDKIIFSNNSVPIYIPSYLCHDIDTLEDWKKAELVFKSLKISGIDK
jgi:N-acylneuraminate cytidylyltransferase